MHTLPPNPDRITNPDWADDPDGEWRDFPRDLADALKNAV